MGHVHHHRFQFSGNYLQIHLELVSYRKKKYFRKALKCCCVISLRNKIWAVSCVLFSNVHGFIASEILPKVSFSSPWKWNMSPERHLCFFFWTKVESFVSGGGFFALPSSPKFTLVSSPAQNYHKPRLAAVLCRRPMDICIRLQWIPTAVMWHCVRRWV